MKGNRAAEYAEKSRIWQKRLSEWSRSGTTQAEYCRQNKLDPKNFIYWKKKILHEPNTASLVELPSQLVTESARQANASHLILVIDGRFRVEVPSGFDAETLDRLIKILNRT